MINKHLISMQQQIQRLTMKIARRILPRHRVSYAQRGEDIIIQDIFNMIGIEKPLYLDIGANDPVFGNNAYLFYANGSRGICVEPNPKLARRIITKRPQDICLNAGITDGSDGTAKFYVFDNDSLSTFSEAQAKFLISNTSYKLSGEIIIPVMNINSLLLNHFSKSHLNFLSLDCEGNDLNILKNMDFGLVSPDVICVETVECAKEGCGEKNFSIIQTMQANDYVAFADTYINTIFIHSALTKYLKAVPKLYNGV